jgi:hypothetical protein
MLEPIPLLLMLHVSKNRYAITREWIIRSF